MAEELNASQMNVQTSPESAALKSKPVLSKDEAREIALKEFGLKITSAEDLRPVDSYEDVNFWVTGVQGSEECARDFILKIHNSADSAPEDGFQTLQAQEKVLEAVTSAIVPKQYCQGKHVTLLSGQICYIRVLSFIPGRLLCEEPSPRPSSLLEEFGRCLGGMDADLQTFSHDGTRRYLIWDLRNALPTIRQFREAVSDKVQVSLIDEAINVVESQVIPSSSEFRLSVIHGDANDHNVIIDANNKSQAIGFIDFGDLVESWLVAEVAIAIAYVMVAEKSAGKKIEQARHVLNGYEKSLPLQDSERKALYGLIVARLSTSVCISATDSVKNPENAEYTLVHAQGGWETLKFLLREIRPENGLDLFMFPTHTTLE